METKYYTKEEILEKGKQFNVGSIHFQFNIAKNTGREFEVGYVFCHGFQELFCKYSRLGGGFKLCNEFEDLDQGVSEK